MEGGPAMSEAAVTIASRPNPYVGTRPYRKGEVLYGRERETSELLDLLIAERIVMLYSPSGAGKSSLLNAAILPKMEQNGFDVLPSLRLSQEPPAGLEVTQGFNRYIFSVLLCMEEELEPAERTAPEELAKFALKDYLEQRRAKKQALDQKYREDQAILLVIDQAEEVINIAPTERDQKQAFFNQLGATLRDRRVWLLFALREDYMARMDSYIRPIPTGFTTRYRLRLLQADTALAAIQRPAAAQGVNFSDEAAKKMVSDLCMVQVQQVDGTSQLEAGLYVEPVQLQVVCRRLWSSLERTDNEIEVADVEKVGDVNTALADYYALQVATVSARVGVRERFIRMWFDRRLITAQGIRGQVLLAPTRSDGLENSAIWELEKTYLIRSEKRGGSTWFELSHDRLITPIVKNNGEWFEKNLSALQRQADVWNQENRQDGMLVTGPDFLEMQKWVVEHKPEMNQVENDFYNESLKAHLAERRDERNDQIIGWLGLTAAFVALIATIFFFRARLAGLRAVARELAAASVNSLSLDPEQSIMLALASQSATGELTDENIHALHRALPAMRVERSLNGHTDKVYAVEFNPDGSTLASGGKDGLVFIWDAATGKELQKLVVVANPGGNYGVTNLAYSPDGNSLAVTTQDGRVIIYDSSSWQAVVTIQAGTAVVWTVAYSPDGRLLATGSEDHTVRLWDARSGAPVATLGQEYCEIAAKCDNGHTGIIYAVVFSPDGKLLASAGEETNIRVWDVATRKFAFKLGGPNAHTDGIYGLAFNPAGTRLASASADRLVKVWDIASQDWVMNIPGHVDWVYAVGYIDGGRSMVTSSSDRTIRIWDTTYGRLQAVLTGHSDQVYDVSLSPDGRSLASASQDKSVRIWNISNTASREFLTLDNKDRVNTVAFSRDGNLLAASGRSPDIKIWDAHTGKLLNDLVGGHRRVVEGLSWGPDGTWLVSAGRDGKAIVWDVASGEQKLVFAEHKSEIWDVVLARDGSFAATGDSSGLIYTWDTTNGHTLHTLKTDFGEVLTVDISPDQKWLAAGYEQGQVVIWDLASEEALATLDAHNDFVQAVHFSATGNMLASASDDSYLILWDLRPIKQGRQPVVFSKTAAQRGTIYDAVFSRDGRYVLTGGADGMINVRDISNPQSPVYVYSLYGFTDRVQRLDANAVNDHIAAGGSDNTVRIFTLNVKELAELARSRLTRPMTENECIDNLGASCEDFANPNILDRITIFGANLFSQGR